MLGVSQVPRLVCRGGYGAGLQIRADRPPRIGASCCRANITVKGACRRLHLMMALRVAVMYRSSLVVALLGRMASHVAVRLLSLRNLVQLLLPCGARQYHFPMSNKYRFSSAEIVEWLKGSGIVAVTVAGLFAYFLFSIPATVFYARLGTTPDEVGITYVSLLSGSTVEISVMLLFLAAALIVIAFTFSYLTNPIRAARTANLFYKKTGTRKPSTQSWGRRWLLTDQEFEHVIRWRRFYFEQNPDFYPALASVYRHGPQSIDDEETDWRRERELWQLGVRTSEEFTELDLIDSRLSLRSKLGPRSFAGSLVLPGVMTVQGIRRYGRRASVLIVAIIIILLPALAFIQAGDVIHGKAYIGNSTGIFEYHADKVKIYAVSSNAAPGIQAVRAQKLFLLGRNAQDAIFYSPVARSTIRIPIATIIIASTR